VTKVTIDSELRSKLHGLTEQVELCDDAEKPLGYFIPAELYKELMHGSIRIPYSDEEIARRRQEQGGRPLAEIWKRLGRS
jgi:hypothetical protein